MNGTAEGDVEELPRYITGAAKEAMPAGRPQKTDGFESIGK
jgi:hypothetical protein